MIEATKLNAEQVTALLFHVTQKLLVQRIVLRAKSCGLDLVPPVYHSLRRGNQTRHSKTEMGVRSLRPTWFENETVAKTTAEPMHGLRLIIKEDVLPISDCPEKLGVLVAQLVGRHS